MSKKNYLFVGVSYHINELTPLTKTKDELKKKEVKFFFNDGAGNRYVFMHTHNLYKYSDRLQVWVLFKDSDNVYAVAKQKLGIQNNDISRLYVELNDAQFVSLNIL